MKILVTGATGYVGGRLVPRLLEEGHEIRVLVRDKARVEGRPWSAKVEIVQGDVTSPDSLQSALKDMEAAYYLVHAMLDKNNFAETDRQAAEHFCHAGQHLKQVIYLGGLLPDSAHPSPHLASRAEVGEILRQHLPTTEFRAGPIIGSGSASFEMIRYLTERLPIMVAPRWIDTPVQPIAIRDVLAYLLAAIQQPARGIVPIGAPPVSFREMMLGFAKARGLKRTIFKVPLLAPRLAGRWVGWTTPISNRLAVPLVEGILHPLLADPNPAHTHFPQIHPIPYQRAVELALLKIERREVETRWTGALNTNTPAFEFKDWEGLIRETRSLSIPLPAADVFQGFCSIGGERGWLVWKWAWRLRGWLDRIVGGPGLRRGRRDPDILFPGEALDFWRVERVVPNQLLLLRAEMKLPGKGWLQFQAIPESENQTRLVQTALFEPAGLFGTLYWYSLYPFHRLIFSDLIRAVAQLAHHPRHRSVGERK